MGKLWSILILTVPSRRLFLNRILYQLQCQYNTQIEIIVCEDDHRFTVGDKRNILMSIAEGKFLSFIDDDDMIYDDFVNLILNALYESPNVKYIGITTDYFDNGIARKPFFTSLANWPWTEDENGFYRDIGHNCPMLSCIAKKFKFPSQSFGEDYLRAEDIRNSGELKATEEVCIIKPLYKYLFFHDVSLTQGALHENIDMEKKKYKKYNVINWELKEITIPIKKIDLVANW